VEVKAINNVYELPSIEQAVQYLHGAADLSSKATWVNSICCGNYLSWPLLTIKNVNKFFSGIRGEIEGPNEEPAARCLLHQGKISPQEEIFSFT